MLLILVFLNYKMLTLLAVGIDLVQWHLEDYYLGQNITYHYNNNKKKLSVSLMYYLWHKSSGSVL